MAGSWQQITAASRESAFDAAQADPEFIEGSRAGSRMDTCIKAHVGGTTPA